MKIIQLSAVMACLMFSTVGTLFGGGRHKAPVNKPSVRVLEATQQKTIPGARGMQPINNWKFIIIWQGTTPPSTFFWRPDANRWMTTSVARIHHFSPRVKRNEGAYAAEEIDLKNIRRGDTLEIIPVPNGRDIMPANVRNSPRATLYYKKDGGRWEYVSTGNIRRLEDIVMP